MSILMLSVPFIIVILVFDNFEHKFESIKQKRPGTCFALNESTVTIQSEPGVSIWLLLYCETFEISFPEYPVSVIEVRLLNGSLHSSTMVINLHIACRRCHLIGSRNLFGMFFFFIMLLSMCRFKSLTILYRAAVCSFGVSEVSFRAFPIVA